MKVIRSTDEIEFDRNSIVTIGTFDGVHIAHQKIIKEAVRLSEIYNCRSVIVTFDPHPREVLGSHIELLTTIRERQDICKEMGVDVFYIMKFDRELSQQSYHDFYKNNIVGVLGAKIVIEGYDHHWGNNRRGNIDSLRNIGDKYKFEVITIEQIEYGGIPLKSSTIRNELYNGDVENAGKHLGRPYKLSGKVLEGSGRGKLLGYPTANILTDSPNKLIPRNGIYFVKINHANRGLFGMMSIGVRPTFQKDGKRTLEVNIFDFNENIYESIIEVEFLKWIREEIKFDSSEKLIEQMNKDKEICYKLLNECTKNRSLCN